VNRLLVWQGLRIGCDYVGESMVCPQQELKQPPILSLLLFCKISRTPI
jgi:hypothetical protein